MISYHPKSWSQQARIIADYRIELVNDGQVCIEEVTRFFHWSYKHPRIILRAAKRFGRETRIGHVHKQLSAIKAWQEEKENYNIDERDELEDYGLRHDVKWRMQV